MKKVCKYCYGKGYATQLVNIHSGADFDIKERNEMLEKKNYCTRCAKGKRLKKLSK